ncbi:hypothetical protein DL767_006529 [Monosporascus sp. MG133]|nr:hypothetical protein DL767_006529 [Monosporascus sp. MG133]
MLALNTSFCPLFASTIFVQTSRPPETPQARKFPAKTFRVPLAIVVRLESAADEPCCRPECLVSRRRPPRRRIRSKKRGSSGMGLTNIWPIVQASLHRILQALAVAAVTISPPSPAAMSMTRFMYRIVIFAPRSTHSEYVPGAVHEPYGAPASQVVYLEEGLGLLDSVSAGSKANSINR